jgi:hypothetical protein
VTTSTFDVALDTDTNSVKKTDAGVWPPNTSTATDASCTVHTTNFGGPLYYHILGLVRWDTSSIPDGDTILSATAKFAFDGIWQDDVPKRLVVIDWHLPAFDTTDYIYPVGTNAHMGRALDTFTGAGAYNDFPLLNAYQVNTSGYTGLRIGISGGAPTGMNAIQIAQVADASPQPRLVVEHADIDRTRLAPTAIEFQGDL